MATACHLNGFWNTASRRLFDVELAGGAVLSVKSFHSKTRCWRFISFDWCSDSKRLSLEQDFVVCVAAVPEPRRRQLFIQIKWMMVSAFIWISVVFSHACLNINLVNVNVLVLDCMKLFKFIIWNCLVITCNFVPFQFWKIRNFFLSVEWQWSLRFHL